MSRIMRTPFLLLLLAAALLATLAAAQPGPAKSAKPPAPAKSPQGSNEVVTPPCPVFQTPRRLDRFDQHSRTSTVENGPDASSIYYTPRGGGQRQTLRQCSQHYHCYIENHQPCNGNMPSGREHCAPLAPGDWVEIHTAYSKRVGTNCDPETLECCAEGPVVVRAYHARVTAGGSPSDPLPAPWHPPFAQWTGSNTGWDTPGQCKPIGAEWSFSLGCDLRVSQARLGRFHHRDPARVLQGGVRVSKDLTRVEP